MNKIKSMILVGSFGEYAFETIYSRYLKSFGVDTHEFDIQKPFFAVINKNILNRTLSKINSNHFCKDINRRLLSIAQLKKPDAVLVFKGMQIFPETVEEIKRHTRIIANYNPDHPLHFYSAGSGNMNVLNSVQLFDVHFSYSQNIAQKIKNRYSLPAYWVPFGYDENVKGVPAYSFPTSFLFIGAWDKERQRLLSDLKEFDIKIFGNAPWQYRTYLSPSIQKMYQNKPLLKGEYLSASNTALGNLNLLRKQNRVEQSHNMRTFEVPGYGGLLISERTEEQLGFFEENKEAVYFSSQDELRSKLRYFSENPRSTLKIKEAGLTRSLRSNYGYLHRVKQLFQILNGHF